MKNDAIIGPDADPSDATALLHMALAAREAGRVLDRGEAIALARAGKFALLWQLLERGLVPDGCRDDVRSHLAEPATRSQRRFFRRVMERLDGMD